MKLIYDEPRAKEHKQEIEAQNDKNNIENRKHDRKVDVIAIIVSASIILILLFLAIFTYRYFLFDEIDDIQALGFIGFAAVGCFSLIITYHFADLSKYGLEQCRYTQDVLYYIATQNKNVLDTKISEFSPNQISVVLVLEDDKGVVTTNENVCFLKREISTKVKEPTLDLENGVCLIPYTKE